MNTPLSPAVVPPQDAPLLDVRELSVGFPGFGGNEIALHDISFTLARSEVLGIVGRDRGR